MMTRNWNTIYVYISSGIHVGEKYIRTYINLANCFNLISVAKGEKFKEFDMQTRSFN